MKTILELMKVYRETGTHDEIIDTAIPYLFDWGGTVDAWDNDKVAETSRKTDAQITALNTAIAYEFKKAILLEYCHKSPVMTLDNWKWAMHARWNREIDYFNDSLQIALDTYEWRTFEDYHIYHDGTNNVTTSATSNGTTHGETENKTGDYPNAGDYAYATGISETTADTTASQTDNGTATTADNWTEYRIGATGQTPIDLQKKAYEVIRNLTKEWVLLFEDLFYYDIEEMGLI